jgi:hypothetical protein
MSVLKSEIQKPTLQLLDDSSEMTSEISPSFRHLLPEELLLISTEIKQVKFSPYLSHWIEDYERVGQRGRFLWQWCWKGVNMTTLPSVDPKIREHVMETKMLAIFYGTLIDDIADREQDREMLQFAISLAAEEWPAERLAFWNGRRHDYLEMISKLWTEVWTRCKTYPCFTSFEHLLRFDNEQTLNAMRYALLANQSPGILNIIEHDLYQPHNMQIMFMATLDLAASPAFDMDELGVAREIFWHAQRMGRIGNMITTWEREVLDRDFTSGIFAHALHLGILGASDLREMPAHEIMSMLEDAACQDYFFKEWQGHRDHMSRKLKQVRSIDLRPYLGGFEQLIKLHLSSRGLM